MASEKADAWMPLYVTDYLGDTMHLTTEQHGAYMLLLMACWKGDGRIPNDDGWLAAITKLPIKRWKLNRLTLLKFFAIADDFITHKRVLLEREKAKEISAERRESGKKGAAKRWQNDSKCHGAAMANASQTGWQNDAPSPSPSPLPTQEQEKQKHVQRAAARFPEFWSAYPVKKGKSDAEKAWGRKGLDAIADRILAHVARMKAEDDDWLEGYAPHGSTYVNGEGWHDEPKRKPNRRPQQQQPSKRMQGVMALQEMTNGLAETGNRAGLPETQLLGFGSGAGIGHDYGNGDGLD